MSEFPRRIAGVSFGAALSLIAAVTAVSAHAEESGTVTIVGELTGEGIECQAMRGEDGTLYTLAQTGPPGSQAGGEVGGKVRVVGKIAEMSFCQQGVTIAVKRIEPAD